MSEKVNFHFFVDKDKQAWYIGAYDEDDKDISRWVTLGNVKTAFGWYGQELKDGRNKYWSKSLEKGTFKFFDDTYDIGNFSGAEKEEVIWFVVMNHKSGMSPAEIKSKLSGFKRKVSSGNHNFEWTYKAISKRPSMKKRRLHLTVLYFFFYF